jgi:hypothetical protein
MCIFITCHCQLLPHIIGWGGLPGLVLRAASCVVPFRANRRQEADTTYHMPVRKMDVIVSDFSKFQANHIADLDVVFA